MKIRIAPQSIRLRIKPAELTALHAAGTLTQSLELGPTPDQIVSFELRVTPDPAPLQISYKTSKILIKASHALVDELLNTERVGATITQEVYAGTSVTVLLEKDFKCLTHRDEDVDAFPNPAA
ncbi:MAG: hypothetical protein AAF564_05420 [Bacteroidota bacterium]